MAQFKERTCKKSGLVWKQYTSLQKCPCEDCKQPFKPVDPEKKKQYKIARRSEKGKQLDKVYLQLRKIFLAKPENQICFIEGCGKKANTVEHLRGHGDNYLKVDTWAPCCFEHNGELERNSELSHQYQLSKLHNGRKGDMK